MIDTAKRFGGWVSRMYHGIPDEEPVDNAADSHINKMSKLDVAMDAVLTQDFANMAQNQHEQVRAYANEVAGKRAGGVKPHGDNSTAGDDGMLIADNIRVTNISRKGLGLVGAIASAGAIGAALWLGQQWLASRDPSPETPANDAPPGQLQLRHLSDFPDLQFGQ